MHTCSLLEEVCHHLRTTSERLHTADKSLTKILLESQNTHLHASLRSRASGSLPAYYLHRIQLTQHGVGYMMSGQHSAAPCMDIMTALLAGAQG